MNLEDLARYIAAGGVTDRDGDMFWASHDEAAVLAHLVSQREEYETLVDRYAEKPAACVTLMRALRRIH